MYTYYIFAIIGGLLFLVNGIIFTFKTKNYKKRYDNRHFKNSQKAFNVLNIICSFLLGLVLIVSGILAFIPSIKLQNHDLVFCLIFTITIAVALIINIALENIYIEKEEKK